MFKRWLAALIVAGLGLCAQAEVPVPALKSRVTDLTGTLSTEQKTRLEQRLAAFEAAKGSQIAVLLLPTTRPEEIEQYSIRVAEAWKVGRKGTDDGVILIVARDDRRLRIEVGYGLEGAIPDAIAKRVISESITPRFKAGDFYGGVSVGVEQLIRLIEGERLPPPAGRSAGEDPGQSLTDLLVPGFLFVLIGGGLLRALLGRFPGALAISAIGGVIAWFLLGLGLAIVFALLAFVITMLNAGTWIPGAGGRSADWSGGSGGASSWGGGGGGFGGGGSSGSW